MRIKTLVLGICFFLIFVCLFILSCSSLFNCENEMDDIRARYGEPEEVNTYSSDGYYSEDWWYWSKGINYTFAWGSLVEGDCDVSTYTFDPISADATAEQKAGIKATLINRQISLKGIY